MEFSAHWACSPPPVGIEFDQLCWHRQGVAKSEKSFQAMIAGTNMATPGKCLVDPSRLHANSACVDASGPIPPPRFPH